MATGGGPRPGVTALGSALGLALLAGGLATACDNSGSVGGSSSGQAGVSPSARTTPAQELCARVVGYWSRKVLDSETYGDYQTMGLSNGQYEILRAVVDDARAVKRRQGAQAAERLIDRRAHEGCADWYRTGGPSNGPWQ
ncbi:hypothetical protein ACSHXN_30125 [Streptomyces sp. HUAS TT11]|uniref:hypothetical protein n=1 Tax=Streptomyces sp. HUAS TT11 TaxID=3447508 RepID=UPI003F65BCB5